MGEKVSAAGLVAYFLNVSKETMTDLASPGNLACGMIFIISDDFVVNTRRNGTHHAGLSGSFAQYGHLVSQLGT